MKTEETNNMTGRMLEIYEMAFDVIDDNYSNEVDVVDNSQSKNEFVKLAKKVQRYMILNHMLTGKDAAEYFGVLEHIIYRALSDCIYMRNVIKGY